MKAEFFKGLSKGLIPSNAIGIDFYIKKTDPHKKGGATCNHDINVLIEHTLAYIRYTKMSTSMRQQIILLNYHSLIVHLMETVLSTGSIQAMCESWQHVGGSPREATYYISIV